MTQFLYILTDNTGKVLGEITNPRERSLTLPLNRLDIASVKVPLWHPMGAAMASQDERLLKVYRRWDSSLAWGAPQFVGPVVSSEEVGESLSQVIQINAVGPLWKLTKRLLGVTKLGLDLGTQANPTEIVGIGRTIVNQANTEQYTGISTGGTFAASSPPNLTWVNYNLKNAAEALAELTASVNSFDFNFTYVEPVFDNGSSWPTLCRMNFAPTFGVQRPAAILEYGTGANPNLVAYNRQVSRENLMTKGYSVRPSNEADPRVAEKDVLLRGLYQDVVPVEADNDAVVLGLINEQLYFRAVPREIINVTVAANARPTYGLDYLVGDYVRARAVVRGTIRFDAVFRVWGVTFTVDESGNERIELELVMP